jgi:hypothetical protein
MTAIEYTLPLYLRGSQNAREHWAVRAKRVRTERHTAAWMTRAALRDAGVRPCVAAGAIVVTIRRHGSVPFTDTDNLVGACKAVRDGIADALEMNDGDPRIEWRYAQAACKRKAELVTVRIEAQP